MDSLREISNIESLIAEINFVNKKFHGQIWWRGHREITWKLQPSVFREEYKEYHEFSGMIRFQHKAHSRHSRVPLVTEQDSWLFLMQHYGLPTRLLDWTESPLLACFFATEKVGDKDNDGAVFALSPYKLNDSQFQEKMDQLFASYDPVSQEIIKVAFNHDEKQIRKIIAIRPIEVDIRMLEQLSVFTLHGYEQPIDELPNNENFLMKFRIPKSVKDDLRESLKHLGIRESIMFPDLDHLAKEIKPLKFKRSKFPEISLGDLSTESST